MTPVVIKLGGSLAQAGILPGWLDALAKPRLPVVIVPGGGAFADAVRATQAVFAFDDRTAHHMALLAMHQTGHMLVGLAPALEPAETASDIADVLARGRTPVWLPSRMAGASTDLPADWTLTSDGLGAWLALQLKARAVWLVKSVGAAANNSLASLAADGIVDPVFARLVGEARLPWRIFGPGEQGALAAALSGTVEPRNPSHSRQEQNLWPMQA